MPAFIGTRRALRSGAAAAVVETPPPTGFPAFAYEAETNTLVASFSTPPTTPRKRTIDRVYKRIKAAGILTKAVAMYFVGADENASFKNWKTPGTYDLTKVGSPTFSADDGWTPTATGQYLNTGLNANVLTQNDLGHYGWCKFALATNTRYGVIDASSNGISCKSTISVLSGRCASGNNNLSAVNHSNGIGLDGMNRTNSANYTGSRNGTIKNTITTPSVALPALPIYLLTLNNNGTPDAAFYAGKQSFWYFGQALTKSQELVLTGAVGEYLEAIEFGEPYVEELGIGTESITAQCIAYGSTAQSVLFALQAARAGKTVAICGGWRDRHYGGMSAGGLNWTDFLDHDSLGGLPKWLITRMNVIEGRSVFYFYNASFRKVMRELLDPTTNGGFNIPIYWTNGVATVQKSGAAITSITTTDGRTFTGSQWFDGSYEGDLMMRAGVSYIVGREAAGTGQEALNGLRTVASTSSQDIAAFNNALDTVQLIVDPWVVPGDTSSGLLHGVYGIRSAFNPGLTTEGTVGTADARVQPYNFRLTTTNSTMFLDPFPTTPPAGYDPADYEMLMRWMVQDTGLNFSQVFGENPLGNSTYDLNSRWGQSSDFVGASWTYTNATYAQREVIWQAHQKYTMGLIYTLQYSTDPRIITSVKTSALAFGWTQNQYFDWHENDDPRMMPQLYVREGARMVSGAIFNGNDIAASNGTTPRISTNTISVASYNMDSHHTSRFAHEVSAGVWQIWNEGLFNLAGGGANQYTPLPIEIVVPQAAQCTNLSVGFCVSCTHVAFGSIRMEFTAMQIGQSMGQAAATAIDDGTTIQNVNYTTVRNALLASASLSGEVAPVLPQLN